MAIIHRCSEYPNIPPKFAKLLQKKPNMFNNLNDFDSFWTGFGNLGRILGFFELWRIIAILNLANNSGLICVVPYYSKLNS